MTPVHGGDAWQVGWELGIPPSDLLDFSANVNPRGLPPRAQARLAWDAADVRLLGRYPDPSARILRDALSQQIEVIPDAIAVGPGAEALLAPILHCLRPKRAIIPVPAFSEYRRVCAQQEIEFVPFCLDRAADFRVPVDCLCKRVKDDPCDVVVLNNPHNPSGAVLDAAEVRRVLDTANSSGATLLIDEAFIDYVPHASLIREAAVRPGLIVIRSLTKFYGCPALRVGYAVAHPETIRRIVTFLPTWPVTQLTIDALAEAVTDREYVEASLRENALERERLADSLRALGTIAFPSAANYLLLELGADLPVAAELRARLIAKHRILIRNCDSYEALTHGRYVRVAVRSSAENQRLIQALRDESNFRELAEEDHTRDPSPF